MEITTDKRIELLTVIQTLDKYWDNLSIKYTNKTLFQCKYKENKWDYFGKYINNGMVRLHNKICINIEQINTLIELVLCYSDPPKLENTADLKTNVRNIFEQKFPLEEFIKGLRQFYLETDFENFIKINQEEYEKILDDFGYKEELLDTADKYLGTETKNYKIIISALIFGHFGIKIQTNENNTMNYSVISPYDYKDKKYIFGTKEYITETLWHEICHLTINGMIKRFINRLDKKEKVLPEKFTKIFYTNTEAIVNEYIIRAITIRLFEICNKNDVADYYLKYHIRRGFDEIESVKNYLAKHCEENNRLIKDEKYKDIIKYVIGII